MNEFDFDLAKNLLYVTTNDATCILILNLSKYSIRSMEYMIKILYLFGKN